MKFLSDNGRRNWVSTKAALLPFKGQAEYIELCKVKYYDLHLRLHFYFLYLHLIEILVFSLPHKFSTYETFCMQNNNQFSVSEIVFPVLAVTKK